MPRARDFFRSAVLRDGAYTFSDLTKDHMLNLSRMASSSLSISQPNLSNCL